MTMLAQGRYVVGKMASLFFPDGIEIDGKTTESLAITKKYIDEFESITMFERAFEFHQRLSRIDIFFKKRK